MTTTSAPIRTPDQRLRIFVSSTPQELAKEREAVKGAIEQICLTPVMFELGARAHPPRVRLILFRIHHSFGIDGDYSELSWWFQLRT